MRSYQSPHLMDPKISCSMGNVYSIAGQVYLTVLAETAAVLGVILEKLEDGMCNRSVWSWKDRVCRAARVLWICSYCGQKHLFGAKPLFAGTVCARSSGRADLCPAAVYKQFKYQLFKCKKKETKLL